MKTQGKTHAHESTLRVAMFEESAGEKTMWVAQCLDFDLVAQGKTLEAAQESFRKTLVGHICLALSKGEKPIEIMPFLADTNIVRESSKAKTKTGRDIGEKLLEGLSISYSQLRDPKIIPAI